MEKIAFVIPAFNEEQYIGDTIKSIFQFAGAETAIVVVDNGSTDNTVKNAKAGGAEVYVKTIGTIGALRNFGAAQVDAEIIVFVDADVTLTQAWKNKTTDVFELLQNQHKTIAGSHCAPPPGNNWFLRHWFHAIATEQRASHLGSGHMIVARRFFEELGGFSEQLRTGEDFEFCQRAMMLGGTLHNDPDMKVYHHDFPTHVFSFMRREIWHGIGDIGSINDIVSSKVALASLIFFALHIGLVLGLLLDSGVISMLAFVMLVSLCLLSSAAKYAHAGFVSVLINSMIFYLYYSARFISFFYGLKKLPIFRRIAR